MINLNRRRFLFRSAAIVAASNLMPGHSLAKVLEPTPRELIMQSLDTISREMAVLKKIPVTSAYYAAARESTVLHRALATICTVGTDRIGTPTNEAVAKYWRRDPAYVPLDVLPVTAMKTALGTMRAPAYIGNTELNQPWTKFVEKYSDGINHAAFGSGYGKVNNSES